MFVKELTKKYDGKAVVDGVSFDIPKRSVISMIGPNGAGKSTVLNILSRLIARDSGLVDFAIIRIGGRLMQSGGLYEDAYFRANLEGAKAAGLKVGVYFFSQAISASEAVEEAEFVLDHIRGYDISGPVVYDTEEIKYDTARTDQNTRQEYTNYCKIFCDTIESEGYDAMIYANMKWMAFTLDMEELTDYRFWYADYHELPQCPYEYTIWQYSENGTVPGINTPVDLNIWFQKEG